MAASAEFSYQGRAVGNVRGLERAGACRVLLVVMMLCMTVLSATRKAGKSGSKFRAVRIEWRKVKARKKALTHYDDMLKPRSRASFRACVNILETAAPLRSTATNTVEVR